MRKKDMCAMSMFSATPAWNLNVHKIFKHFVNIHGD